MISRILVGATIPRFTEAERHALQSLRTQYQSGQYLFTAKELARLRFLRWLIGSPSWDQASDRWIATNPQ
jgi:hypothetical protein